MRVSHGALLLTGFLFSCSGADVSSRDEEPESSMGICEIEGDLAEVSGLLSWSNASHHGNQIWLYQVEDAPLQESDVVIRSEDEVYAVRIAESFNSIDDITGGDVSNGLKLYGTWRGRLGTADPECRSFHGYGYDSNILFEIQGAADVRVIR